MSDGMNGSEYEDASSPTTLSYSALITTLGFIEDDILRYVELHDVTTLRRLIRELSWPSQQIVMAVGALLSEGVLQGTARELDMLLEVNPQSSA